jgi:tripartite-type tricarboxylate transporter receptor subunit TctC
MTTSGIQAINPALYAKMPFDPNKDLMPVSALVSLNNVLVLHPSVKANSVSEVIALAKSQPGAINYASSGSGTSIHMSGEMFKSLANVNMTHIPYKGSAPALNDLLGGQVMMMFDNIPSAIPHIKSGKLKALAVTSGQRSAAMPDLPTIEEAGGPAMKGFEASSWFGLLAPAGTSNDVVQRIQQEVAKALSTPAIKEKLLAQGAIPGGNTPEEFAKFIDAEHKKWAQVVKASGAKVD